jgi:hypothetical protein
LIKKKIFAAAVINWGSDLIKEKNLCSCFGQLGIRFDQGKKPLQLF